MSQNAKTKFKSDNENSDLSVENTSLKTRLNLNDLLNRCKQEKKQEKRYNILVLISCTTIAVLIFIILSI